MLNIYVCEPNISHRQQITKFIESSIIIHNIDAQITLSTSNPLDIINLSLTNLDECNLYFLEINLNHEIDGLTLASIIRERDRKGSIVFITTHDECLPLTFQYKIEAMDFILKDDYPNLTKNILECIFEANKKYFSNSNLHNKQFTFTSYNKIITINYSKILFFETSMQAKHKILLYTKDETYEFYGNLTKLESNLDDGFFRCHHSYIINTRQSIVIDKAKKIASFENGAACPISSRRFKMLIKILNERIEPQGN